MRNTDDVNFNLSYTMQLPNNGIDVTMTERGFNEMYYHEFRRVQVFIEGVVFYHQFMNQMIFQRQGCGEYCTTSGTEESAESELLSYFSDVQSVALESFGAYNSYEQGLIGNEVQHSIGGLFDHIVNPHTPQSPTASWGNGGANSNAGFSRSRKDGSLRLGHDWGSKAFPQDLLPDCPRGDAGI